MPPKQKSSCATDSDVQNTDVILLRFVEMLNDVLKKLRLALFPQALADKIDTLTQAIAEVNVKLEIKESRIAALEGLIVLRVNVTISNNILAGQLKVPWNP